VYLNCPEVLFYLLRLSKCKIISNKKTHRILHDKKLRNLQGNITRPNSKLQMTYVKFYIYEEVKSSYQKKHCISSEISSATINKIIHKDFGVQIVIKSRVHKLNKRFLKDFVIDVRALTMK